MTQGEDLYRAAGVDIDAGNAAVERIKPHAKRTMRPEVLGALGGFGGGFAFPADRYREPILVSGTDGVGTKLKLAFALHRHETIGIDAVAMCVNDILAMGAEPLFFLDYFATGSLEPAVLEDVVKGIADGCVQAGAALIGGETAEMPGMYSEGEYDLAGFAVGAVERSRLVDGRSVQDGDVLIGLPSSGVHSNGFSLVRKLLLDSGVGYEDCPAGWTQTVGDALLEPTRIYVHAVRDLLDRFNIHGMAHITGGGLLENIPRILPDGLGCTVDPQTWPLPPVFAYLRSLADIPLETLYRTWNMGIGYVLIISAADVSGVMEALRAMSESSFIIGRVRAGMQGVQLVDGGAHP